MSPAPEGLPGGWEAWDDPQFGLPPAPESNEGSAAGSDAWEQDLLFAEAFLQSLNARDAPGAAFDAALLDNRHLDAPGWLSFDDPAFGLPAVEGEPLPAVLGDIENWEIIDPETLAASAAFFSARPSHAEPHVAGLTPQALLEWLRGAPIDGDPAPPDDWSSWEPEILMLEAFLAQREEWDSQ